MRRFASTLYSSTKAIPNEQNNQLLTLFFILVVTSVKSILVVAFIQRKRCQSKQKTKLNKMRIQAYGLPHSAQKTKFEDLQTKICVGVEG
jgi:competence protein ComGC